MFNRLVVIVGGSSLPLAENEVEHQSYYKQCPSIITWIVTHFELLAPLMLLGHKPCSPMFSRNFPKWSGKCLEMTSMFSRRHSAVISTCAGSASSSLSKALDNVCPIFMRWRSEDAAGQDCALESRVSLDRRDDKKCSTSPEELRIASKPRWREGTLSLQYHNYIYIILGYKH